MLVAAGGKKDTKRSGKETTFGKMYRFSNINAALSANDCGTLGLVNVKTNQ